MYILKSITEHMTRLFQNMYRNVRINVFTVGHSIVGYIQFLKLLLKLYRTYTNIQTISNHLTLIIQGLSEDVMQKIGAEMNISETAFIQKLRPGDSFENSKSCYEHLNEGASQYYSLCQDSRFRGIQVRIPPPICPFHCTISY